jgi:hypothetical protein
MLVYLQKPDSIRPPLLLTYSRRQCCNNCHTVYNQSCSYLFWRREVDWSGLQKGMVANSCQHGNSLAGPIKGRKFLDHLCTTYWPLKDSAPRSQPVSWGNESVSSAFHDNATLWVVHSFNSVQQHHHIQKYVIHMNYYTGVLSVEFKIMHSYHLAILRVNNLLNKNPPPPQKKF